MSRSEKRKSPVLNGAFYRIALLLFQRKMKKISLSLAAMVSALMLTTSCGTTSNGNLAQGVGSAILNDVVNNGSNSSTSSTNETTSLLGSLLSGVLGSSSTVSQSDFIGTWNYKGADCVFESENLLAKAGGAVAANKIESEINTQLSKIGIKQGYCSFTFNKDNTYTANIGGRTIQGTYSLDSKNKKIKMTYLAGLASMSPHVAKQNGNLSLLIESDKLLTLMKAASVLAKGTSLSAVNSILNNYKGLYVGMQLSK